VKKEKILVVPNGASIKDITYPTYEMKTSMKNHFGFEGSVATFLASGGYKPNDDAADYICSELARRLSTVTFVLVGSICEGISKKYGEELEHNIKLMGIVNEEDKRGLLTASDVALNPVAEGSGTNIKVFDYLAAGLPLVTTSVGARGIDFTDKLNTIIADIGEFPEAIETLLKDAGLRDKLSKGARSLAERYDWKDIAKIAEDRI
jgi:glycosyltransferase involved in cell wall biosynthesis